ncbi:hypothetical protein CAPTEDRAFT_144591 [Capitella teleta]|uniref:Sodium/calcium exchanger membrane region domain-containing protein n=1 Tax=Capitella teleta TaxID=283909 RepID=R7T9Y5_CAPTE|nr:hypothetical protein CAPTEDRAFT_144591 [Capitella teleta]|eukprot:ELT88185.1 hypothetical protein CAPTEDRAFT_144591 [Capitella teleta]
MAQELGYEVLQRPENLVEANRMANNYMFGFRKWKSHVTSRPLSMRSMIVQDLYRDEEDPHDSRSPDHSTYSLGNILYAVFFGWWVALIYLLIALLMCVTIVGLPYAKLCVRLAAYMFWPFGKFVHKNGFEHHGYRSFMETPATTRQQRWENLWLHAETNYWVSKPRTYVWMMLGLPLAFLAHSLAFILTWLTVVFIPMSKINAKIVYRILLLPPELIRIDSKNLNSEFASGDIIMFTHQAINVYYYKYTVDGVNVICVNLLVIVFFALGIGYLDEDNKVFPSAFKFVISLFSIIPLAYYISMAISSISAQTNSAIGAVLNASFGSIVEIILYISSLVAGKRQVVNCYDQLVKSALVGTLLATTLLIPGISMVIGGLKHQNQVFNYRSAGITATLLFVSVAGAFAPSIFARSFGSMSCYECFRANVTNSSAFSMSCAQCDYTMVSVHFLVYPSHTMSLVYGCCLILPVAYVVGLIYSLKTHHKHIYETFAAEGSSGHHAVHWGRVKSLVILGTAVLLMSLCAELVTKNIEPILKSTGFSVYFVGALFLGVVPDIPEILVGIQFALQNNIALSIEVGSCVAVQVCMVQIPVVVLANLVYPLNFYLIFSEMHIWAVVIGVLLNNYVFVDGKSNYFQGACLVATYTVLIMMYFFAPDDNISTEC